MSSAQDLGLLESIILGIVQGLTEFFPVSSDGHLSVFQHLFGYQKENLTFDVLLHAGTLAALFLVFRRETKDFALSTWKIFKTIGSHKSLRVVLSPSPADRPTVYIWVITGITGLFGLALEDLATQSGISLTATGVGFLITAVFLLIGASQSHGTAVVSSKPWLFPLLIALAQSSALMSGISRSGMTIATALILGLRRDEAGRFSFMAAIPIISLAVIYETRKLAPATMADLWIMIAGVLASFITGVFAIKGLMVMLTRLSLRPFGYYCLILGLLCSIWGILN